MNDAEASSKPLYRWTKRPSALDKPSKPTKHGEERARAIVRQRRTGGSCVSDDISAWLRQVENASSNAVATVFPNSSSRQTGRLMANQAAMYAKTSDATYSGLFIVSVESSIVIVCTLEAREILDGWVNEKLRLEAGLDDSDDEQIVQANVRSVKRACNLNLDDDDDDDDDDPLKFLREPKDLFALQDPSVYYETHDETELVKDILHGRSLFLHTRDLNMVSEYPSSRSEK